MPEILLQIPSVYRPWNHTGDQYSRCCLLLAKLHTLATEIDKKIIIIERKYWENVQQCEEKIMQGVVLVPVSS